MPFLFHLVIVAAALGGAIVSGYIYRHKQTGSPLVCPLDADCEAVVHSAYATTFNLPNELLGLGYYGLMFLWHGLLIFYPEWQIPTLVNWLFGLAATGSLGFSVYLIYIQIFQIREWCSWCIFSALCSLIIFLATAGTWFLS